jgi:hypothetical protein
MTKAALKSAVEAVLDLPEEDQVEAVAILQSIIEARDSELQLSPEQIAELREILADPNPRYVDQEEVFAEIDKMLAEK